MNPSNKTLAYALLRIPLASTSPATDSSASTTASAPCEHHGGAHGEVATPARLVLGFGYAIPFIEALLGLALI